MMNHHISVTYMCVLFYSKDTDSSALEEDVDSADYKAWEAKFRCTNLKANKKPSVGKLNK